MTTKYKWHTSGMIPEHNPFFDDLTGEVYVKAFDFDKKVGELNEQIESAFE